MPRFGQEVADAIAACNAESQTVAQRGKALEDLMVEVFEHVDGLDVRARNTKSVFENEELDLVVANRRLDTGLEWAPYLFSVECKNWTRPVGSAEIAWLATKLRRSGQAVGVLVAASGVTGTDAGRTASHFEVAAALAEGQAVLVLTLSELAGLSSGEELADLLLEKQTRLIARREIYIGEARPHGGITVRSMRASLRHARDEALSVLLTAWCAQDKAVELRELFEIAMQAAARLETHEGADEGLDWADEDLLLAEAAMAALDSAASGCINLVSQHAPTTWSDDRIRLWLDLMYPIGLRAIPGDRLSELLVACWLGEVAGPGRERALFSLLGWALEWRVEIEQGGWPFEGL